MVCQWGAIHSFETGDWEVSGFVAVRESIPDELRHVDSILRENTLDSTERQRLGILSFADEMGMMTADGCKARPFFFWKKRANNRWKVGNAHPELHSYCRDGEMLEYSHLWVECYASIFGDFGKCCLAPLAAAMRSGYACLHPGTKGERFVVCHQTARGMYNMFGIYTLSGYIKTKKIDV